MKRKKRMEWIVQDVREWIVSYLVILVIPIVICSVFFLYTYFVIWEETRDSNTAAMQLVTSELDQVFEESFLLEYSIQNNRNVKESAQIALPLDASKRFLLSRAAKEVQAYTGKDKWIKSLYVYFPKNEVVLAVSGAYMEQKTLYERFGRSCGFTMEEWEALLKQRNNRTFLVNQDTGTIGYISSLPMQDVHVTMNVILELDYEYIQNILGSLDYMKNSGIVLTDMEDRVLTSRKLEDIDIETLSVQIDSDTGYQNVTIGGERMMASCMEVQRVGLKLVSIVPYREFWKKALARLVSFLAVLLLCILTGTGVAYFFSVGKQRTWGKFKRIVTRKLEGHSEGIRFRNKEVAAAIENIVQEYDAMQKQLSSVDSMKKELLVTAALKGRIRAEEVEYVFKKNKVLYEIGGYVVILFQLSHFDDIFDVKETENSTQDIDLIRQTVMSIVQELSEKKFKCETLNLEEKIVCIVDFGNQNKEECYERVKELENIFKPERLSVFQAISISDVHKNIFSLHNAYSEASRVMEYQLVRGDEPVMSYLEMVKKTQMSYLYSLENETALIHWIYAGRKEAALQLFEEIYEKNIINANGSEELRKCLMWNLTASVLRAENELKDRISLADMQDLLEDMGSRISLQEARKILEQRIGSICEEVAKAKGKKGDLIAEQVKEYIQEHYADPNLSNGEIAEHFQMNISYLSTFFKEKTGMSPLTYIHWVRLEKARELLRDTDLNVEGISQNVGCNNSVTLTRLFKKYEGITPAAYRKRNRR